MDKRFPATRQVIVLFLFSIILWCVMVFWSLAYLRRIAGGLAPFDLRPFGYDVTEARTFLAAISQIGRDYYDDIQLSLDSIYPAVYALSRATLLLWLTLPGRVAERAFSLTTRMLLVALPVATAIFDYLENNGIAEMLAAGPQVSADVVARASFWTQAKSMAALLTEAMVVFLLAVAFVRWRKQARTSSR